MRKTIYYATLMIVSLCCHRAASQTFDLPKPTADGDTTWYYIQGSGTDSRSSLVFTAVGDTVFGGDKVAGNADVELYKRETYKQLWRFAKTGDRYAITNRATGKQMDIAYDLTKEINYAKLSATPTTEWKITQNGSLYNIEATVKPPGGTNYSFAHQANNHDERNYIIMFFNAVDGNSKFRFVPYEELFPVESTTEEVTWYYITSAKYPSKGIRDAVGAHDRNFTIADTSLADKNTQWKLVGLPEGPGAHLVNRGTGNIIQAKSGYDGRYYSQVTKNAAESSGWTLTFVGEGQHEISSADGGVTSYLNAADALELQDIFAPGNSLNSGFAWKFRRSATESLVALSVSPEGSLAKVDGNITVTFNMPIDTGVSGAVKLNGVALTAPGAWSNSNKTFTLPYSGLEYGTLYRVEVSGFANTQGVTMNSDESHSFTTISREETPSAAIDYVGERLTGLVAGGKYSFNSGAAVTLSAATYAIQEAWTGNTLSIVRVGDNVSKVSSNAQTLPIPARPAAPSGLSGSNSTVDGSSDGSISGVSGAMEYKLSSAPSWTACAGSTISNLASGSYKVRYKATITNFASQEGSVTVGYDAAQTRTLSVTAPAFDSVVYDYARPAAKLIVIANSGNWAAAVSSVTVSPATAFEVGGSGATVPAGGSISTWTLQPKAGLAVETYTATVTVSYNGTSGATASVIFKVKIGKEETPSAAIDYVGERLTGLVAGGKYSFNSGAAVTLSAATYAIPEAWTGNTLSIVRVGDNVSKVSSNAQTLPIPARPAAPLGLSGSNSTVDGSSDGSISGVSGAMEYKLSSAPSWTACAGSTISNLASGSYKVRYKATVTNFASQEGSVTVGYDAAQTRTLSVTAPAFDSVVYGYARPAAKPIVIANSGNWAAAVSSVTVSPATAFEVGGSGATVPAGGSISTWTLQPKAGLNAGIYASPTITVSYNGTSGATATASVPELRVGKAAPEVTWPAKIEISLGQTLASAVFTGESGDGTFAFKPDTIRPKASDSETTGYTLVFTPANTANYATLTKTTAVTVNSATGVEAVGAPTLAAYPNPAQGVVRIENVGREEVIAVYDLSGKLLLRTKGAQVDLSGYPSAVYILQVAGKTIKVAKQ